MPTASELLAAGRADLCRAIQRHGGFELAAKRTGLVRKRARHVQGKHTPLWETEWGSPIRPGKLPADVPTQPQAPRDTPRQARQTHPASNSHQKSPLSSPSTLPRQKRCYRRRGPPRRRRGYWLVWRNLETELRAFAKRSCSGYMPLQRQLRAANRTDLMNAVRLHGGAAAVARRAALSPAPAAAAKKPHGHWADVMLHAELLTFTASYGHRGLMPRRDQLLRAGRADLNYAIGKHGGYSTVAAALHLVWLGPCSYWRVFRNVQKRLFAFVKFHKRGPVMPSFETLQRCGRMDLVHGIALHGGVMMVARRTGLKVVFPERGKGYWERPENVQSELEHILETQPLEARRSMPASVLLVQAGRADLATAVRDHGGWIYYAQRLGLRFQYEVRHQGFWEQEDNVLRELLNYLALRYGKWEHPGRIPSEVPLGADVDCVQDMNISAETAELPKVKYIPATEMLKRDGRSDIAFAIERYHGGIHSFAARHSLVVAEDVMHLKPAEVLHEWAHFAAELKSWIQNHGANGFMPSKHDLIRTGRHDLRYATYKHGGTLRVSQRLQLVVAQATVDKWLPQWLGMQGGKLGLAIQLHERGKKLSQSGRDLLESLDSQLAGSVLGKYGLMMVSSESDIVGNWKPNARRTQRRTLRNAGVIAHGQGVAGRNAKSGGPLKKISVQELERLRGRYKHLPPDDIIIV